MFKLGFDGRQKDSGRNIPKLAECKLGIVAVNIQVSNESQS